MGFLDRWLPSNSNSDDRWLVEPAELRTGRTPKWIRMLLKDAVANTFDDQVKESRADHALFVCRIVARALKELGVRAWVEAGSASWKKYPIGFIYKGRTEFHPWVATEFDEVVDLACDNLHKRKVLPMKVPKGPPTCWTRRADLKDRVYGAVENAAESCGVFGRVDLVVEPAEALVTSFIESNRSAYMLRYKDT